MSDPGSTEKLFWGSFHSSLIILARGKPLTDLYLSISQLGEYLTRMARSKRTPSWSDVGSVLHSPSISRSNRRPQPTTCPSMGYSRTSRGSSDSRYHFSSSNTVPVPQAVGCLR